MAEERKAERALLIVGAFLLFSRFLFLGHTPFVTDEPATHLIVDQYFSSGKFPLTLFRGSQVHIPYGAGALWFYMFLRLFTWNPEWIAYAHTAFFSLGFMFLYLAVRTAYSRIAAAWVFAFAASSPFLFELSRHPWDNTFFVPVGGAILWATACLGKWGSDPVVLRKKIYGGIAALSVLAAYAVNIHVMSIPLAGSAGLTVLYFLWRLPKWHMREKVMAFVLFCGLFVVLIVPYVYAAWIRWQEEPMHSDVVRNTPWGDSRNLWWLFLRETLYSSVWSTKYLFEPYLASFHEFTGSSFAFLQRKDIIGWFPKVAAYVFLFSSAVQWLKGRSVPLTTAFAVSLFFSFLLMMQYSNIPTDAHHFITLWWIVFFGAVMTREKMKGSWRTAFTWILGANIFVNGLFCLFFLGYLVKNGGINSPAHGLGVKFHVVAVREGCSRMRARGLEHADWDIKKAGFVFHSLRYLVRHVPECSGLSINIFPNGNKDARFALVTIQPDTANARVRWEER